MESDVYKMLQDYEKPVSEPKQSGSFRYLQGMLEAGENGKEVGTHSNVPASPRHLPATGAAALHRRGAWTIVWSLCTHQVAVAGLAASLFPR